LQPTVSTRPETAGQQEQRQRDGNPDVPHSFLSRDHGCYLLPIPLFDLLFQPVKRLEPMVRLELSIDLLRSVYREYMVHPPFNPFIATRLRLPEHLTRLPTDKSGAVSGHCQGESKDKERERRSLVCKSGHNQYRSARLLLRAG
jgi:hypothetical protein